MTIREETPADYAGIHALNCAAFGGADEAQLVDSLRADGVVVASLVAEEDGAVIGHILFSELLLETAHGAIPAVSLAPMAVLPARQSQGIGAALVHAGLALCR
jgi:putative acetyltransferase